MRREALKRLHDAFEALEAIERFIENCTLDHYLANALIQSAVERKSDIIGEALKRTLKYEAVDQLILWNSLQNYLPGLRTLYWLC